MTTSPKQSGNRLSRLAALVLCGAKKPTAAEIRMLAASVLSQDQTRGLRKRLR